MQSLSGCFGMHYRLCMPPLSCTSRMLSYEAARSCFASSLYAAQSGKLLRRRNRDSVFHRGEQDRGFACKTQWVRDGILIVIVAGRLHQKSYCGISRAPSSLVFALGFTILDVYLVPSFESETSLDFFLTIGSKKKSSLTHRFFLSG